MRLAYGCNTALPEGVRAAWGARLIWPRDLVHDRTHFAGDDESMKELETWLNEKGSHNLSPLQVALNTLPLESKDLRWDEDKTVTLVEDSIGIIVGNPQGSHGYLYLSAWLKSHVPDSEARA